MVTVALLIGFVYQESRDIETLNSSYADLYFMHKYLLDKVDAAITISDRNVVPEGMLKHIVYDSIDSKIGEFHSGNSEWYIVNRPDELDEAIVSLDLLEVDRLLVYYSGHCLEGGNILFPSGETLDMLKFRDTFTSSLLKTQIMFIMDCCYADHLKLPYRYDKTSRSFRVDDLSAPCEQMVMSITSSGKNQPTLAMRHSSLFTECLIEILESGMGNIGAVVAKLTDHTSRSREKINSKISCSSSYCTSPILWRWLYDDGYEIFINNPTVSLVIIKMDRKDEDREES